MAQRSKFVTIISTNQMPAPELTIEIINSANLGFEEQRRKIDSQIADLRASLIDEPAPTMIEPAEGPHRKINVAAHKRMAAAQRKRWATKSGEVVAPVKRISQPKRKLIAARRAAICRGSEQALARKEGCSEEVALIPGALGGVPV